MIVDELVIGDTYRWVNQSDRLTYVGKEGPWYQFKKKASIYPDIVWCEILEMDLHMIEETAND